MQLYYTSFLELLEKTKQFAVPIYQRTYSWTERESLQLWKDILRTGGGDGIPTHFTGSIVYIKEDPHHTSEKLPLHRVIDGQQRLTTVMLLLEALARNLGDSEPVDGFSAKKVRSYYLRNELEEQERRFKLLLTQTDKESFLALMQQEFLPDPPSHLIKKNFAFFEEKINALEKPKLVALCKGLRKLGIVEISLEHGKDDPQLIFESMNSTGRELSQADLIRNFILMRLDSKDQERLYKEHWRPMEVGFGQAAYGKGRPFDNFMRCYLMFKTREVLNLGDVYEKFKRYSRPPGVVEDSVDALVADISICASHYHAMALDKEKDNKLKLAFRDLRNLKVDAVFPFLLKLYGDYAQQQLSKTDFEQAVRLIEAYAFRRVVCGLPSNSYTRIFVTFGRELEKDRHTESIQKSFLGVPDLYRFPDDKEFRRNLLERGFHSHHPRSYCLHRLENHGRKERVPDDYTVEHIMPQNENLSETWCKELGPDWERVHKELLHNLGNLTLTAYNPELRDRPFSEKRDLEGGFKGSPLRLNKGLGDLDTWNEQNIRRRAEELADRAVQVWAGPTLAPDKLRKFRAKHKSPTVYTIANHPHLASDSPMRPVFDSFQKEVLALDPGITEEFLKEYVAYKVLTNFVDVVPQKRRLLLSLNLQFHELHDPKKLARDVTDLGSWGNGDAQVGLDSLEGLPYVMGLVRQALEKQAGDEAVDD